MREQEQFLHVLDRERVPLRVTGLVPEAGDGFEAPSCNGSECARSHQVVYQQFHLLTAIQFGLRRESSDAIFKDGTHEYRSFHLFLGTAVGVGVLYELVEGFCRDDVLH